ncbi:hypothetical protein EWF20_10460 [Sulfolobus sp. S-194]|uniref:hypothetical protein n=1 Tax=Sulfolobus sp. S-194 TaxID=2512240 RepID=UPI001437096D|nr:hypothetical protein [Sulfolobus sp. S-194]QIW24518.1 hypothetical protein EWF20_10460 [Sulfolobus sp. S-194]
MSDYRKDVIISFITWNNLNIKNIQTTQIQTLRERANYIKASLSNKTIDELLQIAKMYLSNTSLLAKMFAKCNWKKEEVDISNVSVVMPELGDLPKEALLGNLKDTAEFVKNHGNYESSRYIYKLMNICEILSDFPPILIDKDCHNRRKCKKG